MKNRKKAIISIIVFCAVVAVILLCRASFGTYQRQVFAMDTYCSLEVNGGGEKVLDELEKIITFYDQKYNAYNEKSVTYALNKEGISYDEETVALSQKLMGYCEKTEGAFDFSLKKTFGFVGFFKKECCRAD